MELLSQFLLRLTFGLAVGMAITSSRLVSSGYFRNHLYVTLGLTTLAALASYAVSANACWYAAGAAAASYVGSVCWLYEKKMAGKIALLFVILCSWNANAALVGTRFESSFDHSLLDRYLPTISSKTTAAEATQMERQIRGMGLTSGILGLVSNASSGLLMGVTLAAMLLGHWYLNSPGMELAPLRRLLLAAAAAVVLQSVVSGVGMACEFSFATGLSTQTLLFLLLRWLFGLVGVAVSIGMAWQTLKIPNTQSATGILYVAVVCAFVGELAAGLLSAESAFPL